MIAATIFVYWPLQGFDFLGYDDDLYVYDNFKVLRGLTAETITWAFSTTWTGNWHPCAWISHMLDVEAFSLNSGGHHWSSLIWHILNAILLFSVFLSMTGKTMRSVYVAALFALHPLHVESVAWVSERKDVLCAFFWFSTMLTYCWYVKRPSGWRYLAILSLFALGLMSKAMIVTLPFVLLLMDYWPLGRYQRAFPANDGYKNRHDIQACIFHRLVCKVSYYPRRIWLMIEKIPLMLLAFAVSVMTYWAQYESGAVRSLDAVSLSVRFANSLVSYILYMKKMILPVDLAVIYPHLGMPSLWLIILAILVLFSLTATVVWLRKQYPELMIGWFWYLGTLVPVIGIVQVGSQAMADRYTYIPLVGLFVMITWGVPSIFRNNLRNKTLIICLALVSLFLSISVSRFQVGIWRNNVSLFEHALSVTQENSIAHNNLGATLFDAGSFEEAGRHYREALRIRPDFSVARKNMGDYLLQRCDYLGAMREYGLVLKERPGDSEAHKGMIMTLAAMGNFQEAESLFQKYLNSDSQDNKNKLLYWGNILIKVGKHKEAVEHFGMMLRQYPGDPRVHNDLGVVLMRMDRVDSAIDHFRTAQILQPNYLNAMKNLAIAMRKKDENEKRI